MDDVTHSNRSHAQYLQQYERHLRARGLRDASVTAYTGWIRRVERALGCSALELTADDLEEWVADSQWKPNTHQKAVQALQYFYQWAHARGLVEDDASALLRAARAPRPVPNPCPEDVYRAALEQAEGQDFWRLRLAGETGMRRAELAAAHASHVSELVNGYAIRVNGKGGKTRWIPLSPDLALWVRMQRGYVFPNGSGEHLTPSTVGGWYRRALGINVHSLRHRFATIAYHAQRDINAVCELLGHSSIATTQIYVRVSNDDLRQAASAVWDASMFATHGVPVGDQANVIRLVQSS